MNGNFGNLLGVTPPSGHGHLHCIWEWQGGNIGQGRILWMIARMPNLTTTRYVSTSPGHATFPSFTNSLNCSRVLTNCKPHACDFYNRRFSMPECTYRKPIDLNNLCGFFGVDRARNNSPFGKPSCLTLSPETIILSVVEEQHSVPVCPGTPTPQPAQPGDLLAQPPFMPLRQISTLHWLTCLAHVYSYSILVTLSVQVFSSV